MTRGAPDRRPRRAGLLEQLPLRRCREQCGRAAARRDARAGLADHGGGGRAQGAGGLGAGGRPRRLFGGGHRAARRASQCRDRARADRRPPRLRPHHRRHRAADRGRLAESIGAATGADALAFFDAIAPIVHRDIIDMDVCWMASPLGQGRHQGLHQLPDDEGAVSRLPPGPARRRQDRIQGMGEGHALFRGLHADRGDGRARRGHAPLRPDEAGRPRRSEDRALALCGRPAPPGQCARHACGTWSASRPS